MSRTSPANTRNGDIVGPSFWRSCNVHMPAWLPCGWATKSSVSSGRTLGWPRASLQAKQYAMCDVFNVLLFSWAFFGILVYCLTPPTIEHARHSALPEQATFDLDNTVQYHCHTGYVTAGFPRAKCLAIDGQASWYGPDIQCERKQYHPYIELRSKLTISI